MFKYLRSILALVLTVLVVAGCQTTERAAYIGVGTTTTTVEAARQAWIAYCNDSGTVTQSQFDRIGSYYHTYQRAAEQLHHAVIALRQFGESQRATVNAATAEATAAGAAFVQEISGALPPDRAAQLQTVTR